MNFTIATFNLKSDFLCLGRNSWEKRRERLFGLFSELDADITCVQELTPRMRAELSDRFSNYDFIGKSRCRGPLGEHSDIAVRSFFPVGDHHTFRLPSSKSKLFAGLYPPGRLFPRICTTAEISLDGNQRIRVFNTHLDMFSDTVRGIQLSLIGAIIELHNRIDPLPTLLSGDFNALPDSPAMCAFRTFAKNRLHMRDILSNGGATLHRFRGGEGSGRIDYIFAGEEFGVSSAKTVRSDFDGRYASDHYPLLAALTL